MSNVSSKNYSESYIELNAQLNLLGPDGKIQFEKDIQAVRQYFLQKINQNTVFFHNLEEKLDYLKENQYYEEDALAKYPFEFIKGLYKYVYDHKFRFPSFMGAEKFYVGYALKTFDGQRYLERFEDRICATALYLADGDQEFAMDLATIMILGEYQPATPTFLNTMKKQRGEFTSCFLLRIEDNMEAIARSIAAVLQLSKRGGGVAFTLSNLRERGAPIKLIENQASGVIPIMKMMEDGFSYANQLGARPGSGAVWLSAHHMDLFEFLDTKRENADEKIRIKTLSSGVTLTDVIMQAGQRNGDYYQFSTYDIQREYGRAFIDIDITQEYPKLITNPRIKKTRVKTRQLFDRFGQLAGESGYPYLMFEDTVNRANPNKGRVNMSNLCVTADTLILTDNGYRKVIDLYTSQEDFDVIVDKRARDMDLEMFGVSREKSTKMFKTAENVEVFKLKTREGLEIKATAWHKFYVIRDGSLVKIPLNEILEGEKILVQSTEGSFGTVHQPELARILGGLIADGTIVSQSNGSKSVRFYLYGDKSFFAEQYEKDICDVLENRIDLQERQSTLAPKFIKSKNANRLELMSAPMAKLFIENGVNLENKLEVPNFVLHGDRQTQESFIEGLFQLDGTITGSVKAKNISIELASTSEEFLQRLQVLLLNHGVYSRIYPMRLAGKYLLPDNRGGLCEYHRKEIFSLRASDSTSVTKLHAMVNWLPKHEARWSEIMNVRTRGNYRPQHRYMATVESIEFDSIQDVYDVTVENGHSVIFNGIATGNCTEILQTNEESTYHENGDYDRVGRDISCNLASQNIVKVMANAANIEKSVYTAVRALTAVSEMSNFGSVPSIQRGNELSHAIGLGQMNLHGYLAKSGILYGSDESIDFTDLYFATINFYSLKASMRIARQRKATYGGFEESKYYTGEYFNYYLERDLNPQTSKVRDLFQQSGLVLPTHEEWQQLQRDIRQFGLFNAYRMAVAPTGSISYVASATSSIHPIVSRVEGRNENNLGKVYYPAPYLTNENRHLYPTAYELGPKPIIDVYAAATPHVDQGLSLTLYFKDDASTRDTTRAQTYAWYKGIKTLYYSRFKQEALAGTATNCVACEV